MRLNNIIERPILTEKTVALASGGKYVFRVNSKATKHAITTAVKDLFDVDATDVNTMIMPGKKKRILKTRRYTKTKKWKKAIITLKEGQKIDLFEKSNK